MRGFSCTAQAPDKRRGCNKSFKIERLALHQFEDGPVLDSSYEFVPGESRHFSCRMTGYRIIKKMKNKA